MKIVDEKTHLSLKLMKDTHKRLKVLSALSGKSITKIIEEWVNQQNPDVSGLFDSKPKQQKVKSLDLMKANKAEIQKKISAYKAEGMNAEEIAKRLNADNEPTLSGKGKWNKNRVRKLSIQQMP